MLKIRYALEHLAQRSRLTKLMPWLYSVIHPSPITIQWVGVSACGQVRIHEHGNEIGFGHERT